ncbi:hypothetical protein M378DRAFT_160225 [Amanita muscaria Koide BX008]|uniref:Uncharacterized protein n=1 Tax=Amanita muscaria (strain Koide BX008) TaxID=946122 RepID=A0A0C2XD35_AMAMK|nr:hypothetical protein M378DRAFT_160225 [Amanita muscaria Koide BX008]
MASPALPIDSGEVQSANLLIPAHIVILYNRSTRITSVGINVSIWNWERFLQCVSASYLNLPGCACTEVPIRGAGFIPS